MNRAQSILFRGCLAAVLYFITAAGAPAQTNHPSAPPMPPAPTMKSPVDSFRALLVLPSAERREQLASRTPEVRQKLLAKIQEYQALSPEERELRLKVTELRWYLQPLLKSPATNRVEQLTLIPENLRELVATRLAQWDKFSASLQQMMLTNQAAPNYIVTGSPTNLPPLPPVVKLRERMNQRFNQFFELTAPEKEKVLTSLSDPERRQMEKTLVAFEKLTPDQRQQCLISFSKFASMNAEEQQEFLKSAARWSQMSPEERQSWRELVSTAPKVPPLPNLTRKFPPLPPNPLKPVAGPTTNGG